MRNGNQVLALLLIGLGAAALSVLPGNGSVQEVVELQMRMLGSSRSSAGSAQVPALIQYAWAIRAGGVFAVVIGTGSLVIPWINALVYRRTSTLLDSH